MMALTEAEAGGDTDAIAAATMVRDDASTQLEATSSLVLRAESVLAVSMAITVEQA